MAKIQSNTPLDIVINGTTVFTADSSGISITGSLNSTTPVTSASYAETASLVNTIRTNTNATYYLTFVDSSNPAGDFEQLGTATGAVINPSTGHISANAFTGSLQGTATSASFINSLNQNVVITGSLTVITGSAVELLVTNTGVTIGNLITDTHTLTGSFNISGSLLVNGAAPGGSSVKAGSGSAASFGGSPRTASFTFTSAFSDNSYAVAVTGEDARSWSIQSKTSTGFTINTNSTIALTAPVYWIATPFGS